MFLGPFEIPVCNPVAFGRRPPTARCPLYMPPSQTPNPRGWEPDFGRWKDRGACGGLIFCFLLWSQPYTQCSEDRGVDGSGIGGLNSEVSPAIWFVCRHPLIVVLAHLSQAQSDGRAPSDRPLHARPSVQLDAVLRCARQQLPTWPASAS